MNNSQKILKMTALAMLVALGVVISPILRVEGMCPMAHFINIVCSVLLGPWYSLICAVTIGIIRMAVMGIPPLALTGAVFGAILSGALYRLSKGNLLFAFLGEVFGTGIIGAIISYPVMSIFTGKEGISLLFYVPSFTCGTLIGGSIAFAFLKKLVLSGLLVRFQSALGSDTYGFKSSLLSDSISVIAIGVILFTAIQVGASIFAPNAVFIPYVSYSILVIFAIIGLIYPIIRFMRGERK